MLSLLRFGYSGKFLFHSLHNKKSLIADSQIGDETVGSIKSMNSTFTCHLNMHNDHTDLFCSFILTLNLLLN